MTANDLWCTYRPYRLVSPERAAPVPSLARVPTGRASGFGASSSGSLHSEELSRAPDGKIRTKQAEPALFQAGPRPASRQGRPRWPVLFPLHIGRTGSCPSKEGRTGNDHVHRPDANIQGQLRFPREHASSTAARRNPCAPSGRPRAWSSRRVGLGNPAATAGSSPSGTFQSPGVLPGHPLSPALLDEDEGRRR